MRYFISLVMSLLVVAVIYSTVVCLYNKDIATYKEPYYTLVESITSMDMGFKWEMSKTSHLYLSDSIGVPASYTGLQRHLRTYTKDDTVYLHLAGHGGIISGMNYIIDSLKNTGAKIVPLIDGDVYSCHAVLPFAFGAEPLMRGDGIIFFHSSSNLNEAKNECDKLKFSTMTDRGIPIYEKCLEDSKAAADIYTEMFLNYIKDVITKQEREKILSGRDVLISFTEVRHRLHGKE